MTGVELIAAERKRQIEEEGWTAKHDTQHDRGDLALAGICYAAPVPVFILSEGTGYYEFDDPWPWSEGWDKRQRDEATNELVLARDMPMQQRIRNLVKAGALIAAEIDKLQAEQ